MIAEVARATGLFSGQISLRRYARSASMAIFPALPAPAQRFATAIDVAIASRPRIYVDSALHPPSRLAKGAVTISLDFEMAWGWQYALSPGIDFVKLGLHEREQVPRILEAMQEYGVPATWATVGHLFLEECSRGAGGLAHPGIPRPLPFRNALWGYHSGDWYQFDPCTDLHRSPAWYAPDLVEKIMSARPGHEIGCHTFSHVGFGAYCPREVAEGEIEACTEAMARFGLKPTTWVFPGNEVGHLDLLSRKGVRVVRSFPVPGNIISLPMRLPCGLRGTPVSSSIDRGRTWTLDQRVRRLERYVDAAARERMSMHLWFHPSLSSTELENVMVPFLRFCADQREKGKIDILTMEQLVEATDAAFGTALRGT